MSKAASECLSQSGHRQVPSLRVVDSGCEHCRWTDSWTAAYAGCSYAIVRSEHGWTACTATHASGCSSNCMNRSGFKRRWSAHRHQINRTLWTQSIPAGQQCSVRLLCCAQTHQLLAGCCLRSALVLPSFRSQQDSRNAYSIFSLTCLVPDLALQCSGPCLICHCFASCLTHAHAHLIPGKHCRQRRLPMLHGCCVAAAPSAEHLRLVPSHMLGASVPLQAYIMHSTMLTTSSTQGPRMPPALHLHCCRHCKFIDSSKDAVRACASYSRSIIP